jgi:hypothetical protein
MAQAVDANSNGIEQTGGSRRVSGLARKAMVQSRNRAVCPKRW